MICFFCFKSGRKEERRLEETGNAMTLTDGRISEKTNGPMLPLVRPPSSR